MTKDWAEQKSYGKKAMACRTWRRNEQDLSSLSPELYHVHDTPNVILSRQMWSYLVTVI